MQNFTIPKHILKQWQEAFPFLEKEKDPKSFLSKLKKIHNSLMDTKELFKKEVLLKDVPQGDPFFSVKRAEKLNQLVLEHLVQGNIEACKILGEELYLELEKEQEIYSLNKV